MASSNRIQSLLSKLNVSKEVGKDDSDLIGKGSYSTVSLASFQGTLVAVKKYPDDGNEQLQYEARIVEKLPLSPFLTRTIGMSQQDLIMEYLPDNLLSCWEKNNFSIADCFRFLRDVAFGMHEIHRAGLIHRDINGSNVYLYRKDKRWRAKVGDFNIATEKNSQVVCTGTPSYIAPEIVLGTSHSFKSDIYSFGIILFALFLGRMLFEKLFQKSHKQLEDCLEKKILLINEKDIQKALIRLQKKLASYQGDIREFILEVTYRCTQQKPENRPSAFDLAKVIHYFLIATFKNEKDNEITSYIQNGYADCPLIHAYEQKDDDVAPVTFFFSDDDPGLGIKKHDKFSVRKQQEFFAQDAIREFKIDIDNYVMRPR